MSQNKKDSLPPHLLDMIPTHSNAEVLRGKILSILRSFRPLSSLDLEGLAHDIFLEAFTESLPITVLYVRHRMINRVVSTKKHISLLERAAKEPQITDEDKMNENRELLGKLFSLASPTTDEICVIVHLFHSGLTHLETAHLMRKSEHWVKSTIFAVLSRLRVAGRMIEAKKGRIV